MISLGFKRASIRTEAANDVNLWATGGEAVLSPGYSVDRPPINGLLPKLQDAPTPLTEAELRHERKRRKKRHKRNKKKLKSLAKKRTRHVFYAVQKPTIC